MRLSAVPADVRRPDVLKAYTVFLNFCKEANVKFSA